VRWVRVRFLQASMFVPRQGVPRGVNFRTAVILSAAKDRRFAQREILRCAQDDSAALRMTDGGRGTLLPFGRDKSGLYAGFALAMQLCYTAM